MKQDEMHKTCSTFGDRTNTKIWSENLNSRDQCGDLRINGLEILNWVLKSRINMRSFAPTELDLINRCVVDVT